MKAFLVVCLAIAGVSCEADADPYTIGQVLAGVPAAKTALDGQTRILTHTSYPNGVVVPNNVAYTRAAVAAAPVVATAHSAVVPAATYAATYAGYPYASYPYAAGVHYIGKREAEADAEAEPWTIGQVAAGLPLLNAAAEGRAPGHIAYTSYNGLRVAGAPAVAYAAAPANAYAAAPAVAGYRYPATTYGYGYPSVYSGYSGYHYLGKREADAEPEADADAYTIAQVYAGLPYANAVATGHAHNPGYIAYTSYPSTAVRSVYNTVAAAPVAAYNTYPYAAYGLNAYYGK